MIEERSNLRSAGVLVPAFYEELLGDFLVRDDDELLAHHARAVDGPVDVAPFLELLPHAKPI